MSENFPLGAKVIVTNANYPSLKREAEIIKVARVNVYIESHGRLVPFDKETGIEKRSINAGGPGDVIRTPAMVEEDARRDAAETRLRELGIAGVNYGRLRYNANTLEQVISILEQAS